MSSSRAIVFFAIPNDYSISSSIIEYQKSSVSETVSGLDLDIIIFGKKASRGVCILSLFSVSLFKSACSIMTQLYISRDFIYIAAFQSFSSSVLSRNCLQCKTLVFLIVQTYTRRFNCMAWKTAVILEWFLLSSA